jgi:hypothetical protein
MRGGLNEAHLAEQFARTEHGHLIAVEGDAHADQSLEHEHQGVRMLTFLQQVHFDNDLLLLTIVEDLLHISFR